MIIEVKIKTNSEKFRIDKKKSTIYVKAPPEKGSANIEVVKQLSKILEGPVRILAGHKSKRKKIQVPETWANYQNHNHT